MNEIADLEIELKQIDSGSKDTYEIDIRFSEPGRDSVETLVGDQHQVTIDGEELLAQEADIEEYGRMLSGMLFAEEEVKNVFIRARSDVEARDARLRLRLRLRESAGPLHNIRWESMRDPENESKTLLTNESILFSRFIDSTDWRRVELRPRQTLKALVVVANPSNLGDYKLAEIDVEGEVARVQAGLGDIPVTVLASCGKGPATKAELFAELQEGYDILYLVAHGRLGKSEAALLLEDGEGKTDLVKGGDFVKQLADMWERPRLVVLASCESAGTGRSVDHSGALAAIGPQLAREGIPAVLAMQGEISMETVEKFMPAFFKALSEDKEIDTAMAIARGQVRQLADWWMPVLYSRLKSGRIGWYTAGFTDEERFVWPKLINLLQKTTVDATPILGSGLSEPLFGTRSTLAHEWAKKHSYPLALRNEDDFPQVAQFLDIDQEDRDYVIDELVTYLCCAIRERHGEYLSKELLNEDIEKMPPDEQLEALNRLLSAVWEKHQSLNKNDPFHALARLNLPLYITTAQSDILYNALKMAGKDPIQIYAPWNEYVELPLEKDLAAHQDDPVKRPLVFHMFGHFKDRDSLVITEDDYFDYLIGYTRNNDLIPEAIRRALANQTLLILGLSFNTWESRILFRLLMKQEGGRRRMRKSHVSAQIAPTRAEVEEPQQAQNYLDKYFGKDSINIYWGKAEDFIGLMNSKLNGAAS